MAPIGHSFAQMPQPMQASRSVRYATLWMEPWCDGSVIRRISFGQFKEIVLDRFEKWDGEPLIAECSLLQNIVEDLILFRDMSDEAIMDFYREIKKVLEDKQVHIAYIKTEPEGIRTNMVFHAL